MADNASEVARLHDSIASKREALADAKARELAAVNATADELEVLRLQTEDARLDSELAGANLAASPEFIAAGNKDNLAVAQQALANALGTTAPAPVTQTPAPEVVTTPAQDSASTWPTPAAPAGTDGN